jgi:hypothetical protein
MIKSLKRAQRRKNDNLKKKRARKIGKEYAKYDRSIIDLYTKNYNHLKSCSCWMCGNPRRYFSEITKQEQLAEIEEKEQIKEAHDQGLI